VFFWETARCSPATPAQAGNFPWKPSGPGGIQGIGPTRTNRCRRGDDELETRPGDKCTDRCFDREPKSARFSGATALRALDALNTALNNLQEESYLFIRPKGKKKNRRCEVVNTIY